MIVYNDELDIHEVPSESVNTTYEIFFNTTGNLQIKDKWVCSCKGFCLSYKYKGHCSHIRLVLYYLDKLKNEGISFFISKRTGKPTTDIRYH